MLCILTYHVNSRKTKAKTPNIRHKTLGMRAKIIVAATRRRDVTSGYTHRLFGIGYGFLVKLCSASSKLITPSGCGAIGFTMFTVPHQHNQQYQSCWLMKLIQTTNHSSNLAVACTTVFVSHSTREYEVYLPLHGQGSL